MRQSLPGSKKVPNGKTIRKWLLILAGHSALLGPFVFLASLFGKNMIAVQLQAGNIVSVGWDNAFYPLVWPAYGFFLVLVPSYLGRLWGVSGSLRLLGYAALFAWYVVVGPEVAFYVGQVLHATRIDEGYFNYAFHPDMAGMVSITYWIYVWCFLFFGVALTIGEFLAFLASRSEKAVAD